MEQLTEFVAKSFVPSAPTLLPLPNGTPHRTPPSPLTATTPSPPLPEVTEKSEITKDSPNALEGSHNSSLSTAYMISNLISNITHPAAALPSPMAPTWPAATAAPLYPLSSLFGGLPANAQLDQLAGLHSKLAFSTMLERFQEIQHQLIRNQYSAGQLFGYSQGALPAHTFPFLQARDSHIAATITGKGLLSQTGK